MTKMIDSATAGTIYRQLFDEDAPLSEIQHHLQTPHEAADVFEYVERLMLSGAGVLARERRAEALHLLAIHGARLQLVRHLLPRAEYILDLGGANAPLYRMGYPYRFKTLVLVDLPPDQRHESFREVNTEVLPGGGHVRLVYNDMTELSGFEDASFDLIWSGQSIEHISLELGMKMLKQACRVLRPGGALCLDTPNRLATKLHAGNSFIHPDHKHEYFPDELRAAINGAGFDILEERGICGMPLSFGSGRFTYEDFMVGGAITDSIERSYIQYFHCRKPVS